jgi:hypothetical protein
MSTNSIQEIVESTTFEGSLAVVPEHLRGGLRNYILHFIRPGGFLTALLQGDLEAATARADSVSRAAIPTLLLWLHIHAPRDCWGSEGMFSTWLKNGTPPVPVLATDTVQVSLVLYDVIDGSVNDEQTVKTWELAKAGHWFTNILKGTVRPFLKAQLHKCPVGLVVDNGADYGDGRLEINTADGDPWGSLRWADA